MKIFFSETFDDGTVGGSHTCMYNLVRHSDRSKFLFTVGFLSRNPFVEKYKALGVDVAILPIRDPVMTGNVVVRKAMNWYRLEYRARAYLAEYLRERKFDLVLLNNSISVSDNYVQVCNRLGIPIAIYERGLSTYQDKHIVASGMIQASVAISDFIRANMQKQGFRTKAIRRIYDGIDPADFQGASDPALVKKEFGIPEEGKVIGIIGNVRPWKGQRYFIEAFLDLAGEYDDLYGLVIGTWGVEDREFQRELTQIVENSGYRSRLFFLGYRQDVPRLLSALDVVVHASAKPEPFGMVILEAMAARRPVIATDLGGPREILENGSCGILVPPRDGRAIAEGCRRYLGDSMFRAKMIDLAYERCERNFHIRQTVENAARLFTEVTGLNPS